MQFFLRQIGQGPKGSRDLTREEAKEALELVLTGSVPPAQMGGFLLLERYKGEAADELLGFADALRAHSIHIRPQARGLLDIGSPYDGRTQYLVVSPAASIVAAAAGASVVMHGEKDMPPKHGVGVIDVLEALGLEVEAPPARVQSGIEETGFGFMRQKVFSPAAFALKGLREEIALRSNLSTIEKLYNLAGADYSIIGLTHMPYLEKMLDAARGMGFRRILILQGLEGNEDAPTHRPCRVFEASGGDLREYRLNPADYDITPATPEDLTAGDARYNADVLAQVLEGRGVPPLADIVAFNAGIRLYTAERAASIQEGLALARQALESGEALRKLTLLRERTRSGA